MNKLFPSVVFLCFLFVSCSKKLHPSHQGDRIVYKGEALENTSGEPDPSNSMEVKKVVVNKPPVVFPDVIHVNDKAAKKSVDGRLYYDVKGHRYWKNFKDGKYYLFNKSMYKDPDFKPPHHKG